MARRRWHGRAVTRAAMAGGDGAYAPASRPRAQSARKIRESWWRSWRRAGGRDVCADGGGGRRGGGGGNEQAAR
eukprot:3713337-Prymnesium_polylepis.2